MAYMVRQSIMDKNQKVLGYEMRYYDEAAGTADADDDGKNHKGSHRDLILAESSPDLPRLTLFFLFYVFLHSCFPLYIELLFSDLPVRKVYQQAN